MLHIYHLTKISAKAIDEFVVDMVHMLILATWVKGNFRKGFPAEVFCLLYLDRKYPMTLAQAFALEIIVSFTLGTLNIILYQLIEKLFDVFEL